MYTASILWLIALPLSLYLTYRLIIWLVRVFEKKYPEEFTQK